MKSVDTEAGSPTPTLSDSLSETQLQALVIAALDREPDATFERVHAHLRSTEGRSLSAAETEQLRQVYQTELAHPTGAHRIGAVEAAKNEAQGPFRLRPYEIAAFIAAVIPFFWDLPTTTPETVAKVTGVVTKGGFYDLAAAVGGGLALIFCFYAVRQALGATARRTIHLVLVGLVGLVALYHTLFGLGILHRIGLISS